MNTATSVIASANWEALAKACDVRPQFPANLASETADVLRERIGLVREAFEAQYGAYPALQHIEKVVTTQCRRNCKA